MFDRMAARPVLWTLLYAAFFVGVTLLLEQIAGDPATGFRTQVIRVSTGLIIGVAMVLLARSQRRGLKIKQT